MRIGLLTLCLLTSDKQHYVNFESNTRLLPTSFLLSESS
jgi:hypothetical protein